MQMEIKDITSAGQVVHEEISHDLDQRPATPPVSVAAASDDEAAPESPAEAASGISPAIVGTPGKPARKLASYEVQRQAKVFDQKQQEVLVWLPLASRTDRDAALALMDSLLKPDVVLRLVRVLSVAALQEVTVRKVIRG